MKFVINPKYFQLAILLVIVITIFLSILNVFQIPDALGNEKMMKHVMKSFGGSARNLVLLAIGYWIMKKVLTWSVQKKVPFIPTIRNLLLSLRKFHVTVGVVAFLLAIVHSAYFLYVFIFIKREDLFTNFTGMTSFIFLLLLVVFGVILWMKKKGASRKKHLQFSLIFFGFFLIHWLLS
ncbi:MAG TPA: hypothetical protein VK190_11790 [Pseudoneobacillus sp.]|nr:hypothetical protein [Pseudoneobacillus sp.]